MIVVADTTPLCHLAWIEADWLLPQLFGEVHAPERVMGELRAEGAPDRVRQWAANPPGWLKIHPDTPDETRVFAFETIDAGEREALALALALHASLVIVDDRAARRAAEDLRPRQPIFFPAVEQRNSNVAVRKYHGDHG